MVHRPLPWPAGEALLLPQLYQAGIWAALVIGIGFTSVYAWRIASESTRMSAGLAATQLALSREHRLASLGALATAAAHELGTPLGTIAVVARELERALPENSPEIEDVRLLRAAGRTLPRHHRPARQSGRGDAGRHRAPAAGGAAGRHRRAVSRRRSGDRGHACADAADSRSPQVWRAPELLHGLGNIIENAADFASSRVRDRGPLGCRQPLRWSIEDDGPGFAPEIFERIGEPYVTSRPGHHALGETEMGPQGPLDEHEGMGLGFFIAKILLEQTGGVVKAANPPGGGARVAIAWARGVIDGPRAAGPAPEAGVTIDARAMRGLYVPPPSVTDDLSEDKTLLIVEDDRPLRERLARAMEARGFTVAIAESVAEGKARAKEAPPAYAVVDLKLDDGNGLDVVETLHTIRPESRVVVLTGFGNIATAVAAVKYGAIDYLPKPADADDILAALMATPGAKPKPPENPMSADRVRWEHIQRVYELCGHNVSETARRLNMHRRTLQRILAKRSPR